jgi:hypothetical protein
VAGQFESKWTFFKFRTSNTAPLTPSFYYTLGVSADSRAYAVEIDRANNRLFVSGQYDTASDNYSLISAFDTNGNNIWGKQADPSNTFIAHYLSYFEPKLFACGDNGMDMHILRLNFLMANND